MFRIVAVLASISVLLLGCVDPETALKTSDLAGAAKECGSPKADQTGCKFRNAPLKLQQKAVRLEGRPYTFYPIAQSLQFIDGETRTWTAAQGTLTDGASIPEIFVPLVGSPRSREFANAAAVHDAYCGVGNEDGPFYHAMTWQATHRMFYDTLIAGGTPETKAKIMFTAVWLRGPRWNPHTKADDTRHEQMSDHDALMMMAAAMHYIEDENPTIPVLVIYLTRLEARNFAQAVAGGTSTEPAAPTSPTNGQGQGNGTAPPVLVMVP
ncbi:MAG: DUF1353 domain-containing protein [Deltaproteobacteria bacterium]